jgi:hypothetical protein
MKKLLVVSLLLNIAFFFSNWHELPSVAQGAGAEPVATEFNCYDANGDGDVDIADPVALLNWLFLGRGMPEVCPSGGDILGLPDSGQTFCWDVDEGEVPVPCDIETCPGQDGFYATGCPSEGRFVDNEDGTVTDSCTGLMWQKETADVNGDGMVSDGDRARWCDALAYAEGLTFADYDDWRLPNVMELHSIVDYGFRISGPSTNPIFEGFVDSSWKYWSSTLPRELRNENCSGFNPGKALQVSFGGSEIVIQGCEASGLVRAVRTAD